MIDRVGSRILRWETEVHSAFSLSAGMPMLFFLSTVALIFNCTYYQDEKRAE
jgi:hypothetical protein